MIPPIWIIELTRIKHENRKRRPYLHTNDTGDESVDLSILGDTIGLDGELKIEVVS
jgi:hypothetical protein